MTKAKIENKFIYEFIRAYFGTGNRRLVEDLIREVNPEVLTEHIYRHGLLSFFYKAVEDGSVPLELPPPIFDKWKQLAGRVALHNTLYERVGAKIFADLNQKGLDYTLLKGFSYAEELYGDKWTRPVGDLDMLISGDDYPSLRDYLFKQGFQYNLGAEYPGSKEQWIDLNESFHNEMHFIKQIGQIPVYIDVHWDVADLIQEGSPLRILYPLNEYPWLKKRETIEIGNIKVNCLERNMYFIHMVYHFSLGHQFAGVKWFLDLCLFTAHLGGVLDWELINKIISREGCQKIFGITRHMVSEVVGENHPGLSCWKDLDGGKVNHLENSFYRKRLFARRSRTGTYFSFIFLPAHLNDKWKVLKYILFNPEALPEWRMAGKRKTPVLQPFHILFKAVKEQVPGKRRN